MGKGFCKNLVLKMWHFLFCHFFLELRKACHFLWCIVEEDYFKCINFGINYFSIHSTPSRQTPLRTSTTGVCVRGTQQWFPPKYIENTF